MRGRVRKVVIYFKFHENRSRGLEAVGVENCPLSLTRPMAYTTACTTVQAVMILFSLQFQHNCGDRIAEENCVQSTKRCMSQHSETAKGVILTVPGSVWFGSVRNRSDFDASGSVNRKRVYGSVRDQSEPSS